jgi:pimeloyl-ACP methyl ester carboxylesterase
METQQLTVEVTDGRRLEVVAAGPVDGLALVSHTGTPAGLVPFAPMVDAAAARGLRTVLYARPGYGGATPRPGRTVADAAEDVAAILDELGHDAFVTAGWSGGGPHALACAALLPDRCRSAATIAAVAPYRADGLDFLAGMGPENVEEFGAAAGGEAPLTAFLDAAAAELREVTAEQVAAALGGLASEVDTAALSGEFAEHLASSFRTAVAGGIAGWRDDDLAFVRPWGFGLDLAVPVAIWQGGQDRMVPYDHGRWLADHVGGARPRLLPGEGHLSLPLTGFGAILDDLLEPLASRRAAAP